MTSASSVGATSRHSILSLIVVLFCGQVILAAVPEQGSYDGGQLPDDSPQLWTMKDGNGQQLVERESWIVRQPENFLRGIDFGQRERGGATDDIKRMIATLGTNAERHGIRFFGLRDPRQGIGHIRAAGAVGRARRQL